MEESKLTHCIIGRTACGCTVAISVYDPTDKKDMKLAHRDIWDFMKSGLSVRTLPWEEYQADPTLKIGRCKHTPEEREPAKGGK